MNKANRNRLALFISGVSVLPFEFKIQQKCTDGRGKQRKDLAFEKRRSFERQGGGVDDFFADTIKKEKIVKHMYGQAQNKQSICTC